MYVYDTFLVSAIFFFMMFCVMISVAFLTLLERKVLSYMQIRKGPNKVSLMGLLQPFCDAIKLFSKENFIPQGSNYLIYYISPIICLFMSLLIWLSFPFLLKFISFKLSLLFIFSCLSVGVYPILFAGWSSNSLYALLGGLRSIAQTISYEVSLILIFLCFILLQVSFNLVDFSMYQKYIWFIFFCFPLGFIMFISFLAETNRSPFDFAEGESELVSGFNVEYSSGGFALIFLAEYSSILFMSMMYVVLFLGGYLFSFSFYLKLFFISFLFIWVRSSYPRYRYDKLMNLMWKIYLPIVLNFIFFFIGLKFYLFLNMYLLYYNN